MTLIKIGKVEALNGLSKTKDEKYFPRRHVASVEGLWSTSKDCGVRNFAQI